MEQFEIDDCYRPDDEGQCLFGDFSIQKESTVLE